MRGSAFTGTPSYVESFRKSAIEWGRDPGAATRSVVLHDFGHNTAAGRDMRGRRPRILGGGIKVAI
jgi:hypothetical protein